ncbi:hypothetical protein ABVB18_04665 [Xanthomonas citri pv. mangiferaeindicae]|nr:hypothetical protein [Xanthomonas citri]OOW53192.1 hypothetical protein Xcnt_10925 [Xanthomonas campestris pv. centellae]UDB89902.1 hypothetical protein LCZ91_08410 [Xanthomonas citri pv. mangiferaeindicae]
MSVRTRIFLLPEMSLPAIAVARCDVASGVAKDRHAESAVCAMIALTHVVDDDERGTQDRVLLVNQMQRT